MAERGVIQLVVIVNCGGCDYGENFHIGRRSAYSGILNAAGWRYSAVFGWLCKKCSSGEARNDLFFEDDGENCDETT